MCALLSLGSLYGEVKVTWPVSKHHLFEDPLPSLCSSFLHKLWPLCALCHCRATGLYSLWPSSLEHLFFQAQPRAIGCSAGGCSFCTSASTAEQWASRAQDVQSISPACDPTVSHGLCQGHKKRFPALLCCNTI